VPEGSEAEHFLLAALAAEAKTIAIEKMKWPNESSQPTSLTRRWWVQNIRAKEDE